MKQTIWMLAAVFLAAGVMIAQAPAPQAAPPKGAFQGKLKGKRLPAQSPASGARPQTVTEQEYPADQVAAGEAAYTAQCGFCHGRDATGGESGPDLTRSELVAEDVRGDKIGPLLTEGRPDEGMPAFKLSAAEQASIIAFVHTQKTKFDQLGGDRRQVDPEDLDTGNAEAGRRYFNGAGGCSGCHSPTGDLQGVGSRFAGLALMQRMLYPGGRPAPARPKVTITPAQGAPITADLAAEDEFSITITNAAGERQSFSKAGLKYSIDNPLAAHYEQLGKYNDKDMHDVYAYLNTLK